MEDRLRSLAAETDPIKRARRATALISELQDDVARISDIRREAIEELGVHGWTQSRVAKELGMTRGRLSQLLATSSPPPPERAFMGSGTVTVVLGPNPDYAATPDQDAIYLRLRKLA